MSATRPAWRADPADLPLLVALGERHSVELLRHLVGPPPGPVPGRAAAERRRRTVEFGVAVLCVLAVVVLYVLLVQGLSVPVDAGDPGLLGS